MESRKQRKIVSYTITIGIFLVPIFIILLFPAFGIILTLSGILAWRCWDKITDIAKRIHKLIYKTEMY